MVKTLVVIYGTNGAGKTSLARNILGDKIFGTRLESGMITLSEDESVCAIGGYFSKCGGVDGIKNSENWYKILYETLLTQKSDIIVMEGSLLSTLLNNPLKNFLKAKYEYGLQIECVFLKTSAETAIKRVYSRNGKIPKAKVIIDKLKRVNKLFEEFSKLKEFNCFQINVDNLNQSQVYDMFLQNTISVGG